MATSPATASPPRKASTPALMAIASPACLTLSMLKSSCFAALAAFSLACLFSSISFVFSSARFLFSSARLLYLWRRLLHLRRRLLHLRRWLRRRVIDGRPIAACYAFAAWGHGYHWRGTGRRPVLCLGYRG